MWKCILGTIFLPLLLSAAETKVIEKTGIETLQLGSSQNAVVAGQNFDVGLLIQHIETYHTYWKAPGIVGYPTTIEWELPEGFSASAMEWPVPERTKMAEYDCYGYENDVCLVTQIRVPDEITTESVTLKAKVSFMCCAKTCHPGWQDFTLTLPVTKEAPPVDRKWQKLIQATRKVQPVSAPENWQTEVQVSESEVIISLTSKEPFAMHKEIHCFCEKNLVHSNYDQVVERSADKKSLVFRLVKSEFAPKDLKQFSGLLFHPSGWPGTSSKWISLKVPFSSSRS